VWNAHNLLLRSQEFDSGASWLPVNVSVTADQINSPNNTLTADLFEVSSLSTGTTGIYQNASVLAGIKYSLAVWVKAGSVDKGYFQYTGAAEFLYFDLATQSVSISGSVFQSGSVVDAGNGWYLVSATYIPSSDNATARQYLGVTNTFETRSVVSGDSLYFWGAHLYRSDLGGMAPVPLTRRVAGSTTYVPTTSAAVYLPREEAYTYVSGSLVGPYYQKESDARTNLLHTTNALVTQTLTVTAVPHTLHFTGTGTVTLLGVSAAGPLVGTGTGENNRVSLTFTPTAGILTLTVSGTVSDAQLEVGSTLSSYIPNLAASGTVTRSADSTTISAGNMPAYTNALSFQMEGLMTGESSTFANWTLDANNGIQITSGASDFTFTQEAAGVVDSVTGGSYTSGVNTPFNIASRHGSTFVNGAVDGTALTADTTPTALPDLSATTFDLAPTFNGFVKLFRVWADDIGDTGIAEAST
jgi:hypothetical protein